MDNDLGSHCSFKVIWFAAPIKLVSILETGWYSIQSNYCRRWEPSKC